MPLSLLIRRAAEQVLVFETLVENGVLYSNYHYMQITILYKWFNWDSEELHGRQYLMLLLVDHSSMQT